MFINIIFQSIQFLVAGVFYMLIYLFNIFFLMERIFIYKNRVLSGNKKLSGDINLVESVFSGEYEPVYSLTIIFKLAFNKPIKTIDTYSENPSIHLNII